MNFLRIDPEEQEKWNSVWRPYEESFPIAERRKMEDHLLACTDERFFPLSAWDGDKLAGDPRESATENIPPRDGRGARVKR